jgi:hypothetical protein
VVLFAFDEQNHVITAMVQSMFHQTTGPEMLVDGCDLPIDGVTGLSPGRNAALPAPHSAR